MLLSLRRVSIPELAASLATTALVHTRFRVHLVRNESVVTDDAIGLRAFDRRGALSRPVITVVRRGTACLRLRDGGARWLREGDVAVLPGKEGVVMRQEGSVFESLVLEWEPGTLGARVHTVSFGHLGSRAMGQLEAALSTLPRALEGATSEALAVPLAEALSVLHAEGVPVERVDPLALAETVDPGTRALSALLDRLLSRLEENPMSVDLERALGVCPKAAARMVTEFNTRYAFNASGWRDTVNRRRLLVGAALMSAKGARTERVSARLGYSSPTSFCRAMSLAGMPSPAAVREVLAAAA